MMGGTTKSQSLGLKLVVLILASLFLNVLFGYYYVCLTVGREKSDWSASAAEEAEEAGAVYCSGHGRAYLDGKVVDGDPVCECNTCYTGEDCSLLTPDCPADANSPPPPEHKSVNFLIRSRGVASNKSVIRPGHNRHRKKSHGGRDLREKYLGTSNPPFLQCVTRTVI
ncbi:hypothetical protein KSP40_PGU001784 [Platanthera guangdongensis]|uniref:Alliinase EGF-like domain-containing protein n=1 Tax=Platanthera guangdongensis TaxID=2320717 RepID=A0ABR2LIV6_9ASPA